MCNITDATLMQIVGEDGERPNHRLRQLKVDNCRAVTGNAIAALLALCPNLEMLSARDCPAIAWSKKNVVQVRPVRAVRQVSYVRPC
jgi:hypothetical protein